MRSLDATYQKAPSYNPEDVTEKAEKFTLPSKIRGGMKSLILHITYAYQSMSLWVCPNTKLKQQDPRGFTSSTVVVLIAYPIHIGLEQELQGFILENYY